MGKCLWGLDIHGVGKFRLKEIASGDVDAENCFTPLCAGELPVEDGHLIVDDLNAQAKYAQYRVGSKDAHSMASLWVDSDKHPQFEKIAGYADLDIRWKIHGVPGTFGFNLIEGLPPVTDYDYFVWKGIELNMHPYGMCYHDLHKKLSTGMIEWLRDKGVKLIIVGGLATDYCVFQTVMEFLAAGFTVILNLSACRGIAPDTTVDAIQKMRDGVKGNRAIIIEKTAELEAMAIYE
jgi:nicotinamidase/pyrazinamidase